MRKDKPKTTCSSGALARLLNLSTRRIRVMAQDGIIPKPTKPGLYDLYECTHRYIDYLKNRTANKSQLDNEIKQIKKARLQLELERERGLYIPRSDVAAELVKRIVVLKRDFKALENKLAKYPAAKEIVKRTHRNMMVIYSKKAGVFRHDKTASS